MKIIAIYPNGTKDTIARLISDGFDHTDDINLRVQVLYHIA